MARKRGVSNKDEQIARLEAENERLLKELRRADMAKNVIDDMVLCPKCSARLALRLFEVTPVASLLMGKRAP